jgi:hypothetical protein
MNGDDDPPRSDIKKNNTLDSQKELALKPLKLPESHKITATQINEASHSRRIGKRRERRLKMEANKDVQVALEAISKKENSLKTSQSMADIDSAHRLRQSYRDVLRGFEQSRARTKDIHTQRLRTERAWSKLAAAERRYITDYARKKDETGKRRFVWRSVYSH